MLYTPEQERQWQAVVAMLRDKLIPVSFNTWIKPLKLHSVSSDTVTLSCGDYMVINSVRSRYLTDIYSYVNLAFGRTYEIAVKSDEELESGADVKPSSLNPAYCFENFITGGSNSFAYAASLAVAEDPGASYNPLFIYGGPGLGKTHLINAIGNYIAASDPSKSILLTTTEAFTNDLIEGIMKKDTSPLRNRMRSADVLMFDDIQFISRSQKAQEELFHTFNDLHAAGKQIVLTSDRPPKDIATLEERLRTRFEWGLTVDIQKPDYETRVAILQRKVMDDRLDISRAVIEFVAHSVDSNVRELEGALTRLAAQQELMGTDITPEIARQTLSALISSAARPVSPDKIVTAVCDYYGVSKEDVTSRKRSRDIALPRQVAMYLMREMLKLPTTAIGDHLGGRDHTTVMHGCEKIEESIKEDFDMRRRVEEIRKRVEES